MSSGHGARLARRRRRVEPIGPIAVGRSVGLPQGPEERDACHRTARAVCASAAALVHSLVLGGAACRLLSHPRPVRPPDSDGRPPGMLRLRTVGRRTGEERTAILGYFEDGPDLVTMAMNGWADPSPPGGSTCRPIPTSPSICPVGRAPSTHMQRTWTSGRACGRDGPSTTRISTPLLPGGHAKPRSSSCRPDRRRDPARRSTRRRAGGLYTRFPHRPSGKCLANGHLRSRSGSKRPWS